MTAVRVAIIQMDLTRAPVTADTRAMDEPVEVRIFDKKKKEKKKKIREKKRKKESSMTG